MTEEEQKRKMERARYKSPNERLEQKARERVRQERMSYKER